MDICYVILSFVTCAYVIQTVVYLYIMVWNGIKYLNPFKILFCMKNEKIELKVKSWTLLWVL